MFRNVVCLAALSSIASTLGAWGCSSSDSSASSSDDLAQVSTKKFTATAAQMNDVSILFPRATSQTEFDGGYVAASREGVGGALVPQAFYESMLGPDPVDDGHLLPGMDPSLRYKRLRVVAVRLDPCFAHLGPIDDASTCENQLRVVFQTLSFQGGSTSAVDGAIHAFYSLSRDELTQTVQDVISLRNVQNARDLGPLAVHPVLTEEGLTGPMARGINELLLKHAGTKNLIRLTMFTPANLATNWTFSGFDVKNGNLERMKIPTLPSDATNVRFFVGFTSQMQGVYTPPTTAPAEDDMQLLANFTNASAATAEARQTAFDATLRISNPDVHSPNTIDCASCHTSRAARDLGEKEFGLSADGNSNQYKPNTKYVSADHMTRTTPASRGRNFHAFSYRFDEPMIMDRVINETASIVAYLNDQVLPAK